MELNKNPKVFIIAIDGYSSCGKSTLARQLANHLKFIYIDSGAMYRAVTLYFLEKGVDINDASAVSDALGQIRISFDNSKGNNLTLLNGVHVEDKIRSLDVSKSVSEVAAISAVRKKMVALQRVMAREHSVIMDGRDIGTVVFPDANIKLFLTADDMVRAQRRYDELKSKANHDKISLEEVLANIKHRDEIDTSRADSPLVMAADAILIDNTHLTVDGQFELALSYILKKRTID